MYPVIHFFLLFFGVTWGIVICVMLISASRKADKKVWLVTVPGIMIIALLALNFTGHMLHLPYPLIPCPKPIMSALHWTPRIAAVFLVAIKLWDVWSKKRTRRLTPPQI